jgi:hypothetical protein
MANSLGEELPLELARNRALLDSYKAIGPAGTFGAAMIQAVIVEAEAALTSGDVVAMLRVYPKLKDSK